MPDLHPDQFGAMHSMLQTAGGFTYNTRQQRFHEEGFVVSTHPEHEDRTPTLTSSPATIQSYAGAKAAPLAEKPNMLGAGARRLLRRRMRTCLMRSRPHSHRSVSQRRGTRR